MGDDMAVGQNLLGSDYPILKGFLGSGVQGFDPQPYLDVSDVRERVRPRL